MLIRMFLVSIVFVAIFTAESFSQVTVEDFASGLINPIGLTIDANGNLWVAEQGTGNDDSRISIVTTAGNVFPFFVNLPSEVLQGSPIGAEHVLFDVDGKLLIVQGEGSDSLSESIIVVDPTGFIPGDPPLTLNNIEAYHNIGHFSIAQGGQTTNPFRIEIGPNNDWYISDAGFNGVIKRERTSGTLSVFSQLGAVVSTGLVYTGTDFFIGSLTGFPFPIGGAKIYKSNLNGNNSVYQDQLTTIIDLAIDPMDNKLTAIQHAEFSSGFQNNTGALFKIYNSNVDTLIYGLNFPAGLVFNSSGELFITSFADGKILKVTNIPLDVETDATTDLNSFSLNQNYPNPFNPSTTIEFTLPQSGLVRLSIFNILGEEIKVILNEERTAGNHSVQFNASQLSNGIYFYKLQAGHQDETKKMILMK